MNHQIAKSQTLGSVRPSVTGAKSEKDVMVLDVLRTVVPFSMIRSPRRPTMTAEMAFDDLPCPWCSSATVEGDPRCPSCDRRFG